MILSSYMFRRATIVGVGLIGGAMGLALKKHKIAKEVVGLSHRQSALTEAIKMQAIDVGATDLPRAISSSDLVILATPVDSIVKLLTQINPHLRRGTIVTDVGSTKAEIVEAAYKVLSSPENFVGAHPLAGSEKRGVEFSNTVSFENSVCLVTPHPRTNPHALKRVTQMWSKFGVHVKTFKPEEHDTVLAYVSHLPHVLAFSLIETIPDKYLESASTGLKDTTRIASSSPKMWTSICLSNTKPIVHSLDDMIKRLADLRKLLVERNEKDLEQHFTKSKEKRDKLS